jgi:hypothetical protein
MKKWLPFGVALLALASLFQLRVEARPAEGLYTVQRIDDRLRYRKGFVHGIPLQVVEANLRDPEVKVAVMVARGGIGHSERFTSMLNRARPHAAITGTFFGIRNLLPTGDIVVNRQNLFRGFIGSAMAITNGNVVSFISTDYKEEPSWHLFDTVVRTGPRLVDSRQLVVAPREEGFKSLSSHNPRPRTAIGITSDSRLLLVAAKRPISLYRLGVLMQALGAYHAVAMDGGSSTALSFGGKVLASPSRKLTNLLVIYASKQRYAQGVAALAPRKRPAPALAAEPPSREPTEAKTMGGEGGMTPEMESAQSEEAETSGEVSEVPGPSPKREDAPQEDEAPY